ncbi:hypothetical protein KH5_21210 [Urechidicola sp. KH5]
MKTINNFNYIFLLALLVFAVSCSEDDEVAVAPLSSNIQMIVQPFVSISGDIIGEEGENTAVFNLGFKLNEDATSYYGSDIIIHYDGQEYLMHVEDDDDDSDNDNEVIIGATPIDFVIDLPGDNIPYNGATIVSEIEFDSRYEIEVVNRPNDLVVLKQGALEVSATVYGQLPPVTEGQINFLFDWNPNDDAGNDLDLFLRNSLGISVDSSLSVSNYEDVSLMDSDPDDTYEISADPWSTIGGTIDGILFAMHPDGTLEVFEMDLTGIASPTLLVTVDKMTDAGTGEVTYTVTQD